MLLTLQNVRAFQRFCMVWIFNGVDVVWGEFLNISEALVDDGHEVLNMFQDVSSTWSVKMMKWFGVGHVLVRNIHGK